MEKTLSLKFPQWISDRYKSFPRFTLLAGYAIVGMVTLSSHQVLHTAAVMVCCVFLFAVLYVPSTFFIPKYTCVCVGSANGNGIGTIFIFKHTSIYPVSVSHR